MLELCLEICTTCIFGPLVYKENLCYFVSHLLVSLTFERLGFEETPLKLEKLERSL
ncbi:hypothetical protein GIB67_037445 [Kingdonia uniflora]|uniref:Uncharacterized protein n=1 Tax=Kingdonia uniflora TaxID=39325 RepID=A0A7J7NIX9_9MAGN|nr:hypothetical protein GIB67_037445 [Kingdonia uniflora]